jgi:hypothetical protein
MEAETKRRLQLLSVNRVHAALILLIAGFAFFHSASSVRKFFHSRVKMDSKNEVVNSKSQNVSQLLATCKSQRIQIYGEQIGGQSRRSVLCACRDVVLLERMRSTGESAANWR